MTDWKRIKTKNKKNPMGLAMLHSIGGEMHFAHRIMVIIMDLI